MLMAIRNTVAEMKQLDDENEFGRLEIHIDNMKEEDWANNWKKYFHPLEVGEKKFLSSLNGKNLKIIPTELYSI